MIVKTETSNATIVVLYKSQAHLLDWGAEKQHQFKKLAG